MCGIAGILYLVMVAALQLVSLRVMRVSFRATTACLPQSMDSKLSSASAVRACCPEPFQLGDLVERVMVMQLNLGAAGSYPE